MPADVRAESAGQGSVRIEQPYSAVAEMKIVDTPPLGRLCCMTRLQRSFLLGVVALNGCTARISEDEPSARAVEQKAVCTSGERPEPPVAPTNACLEEAVGEGSVVLGTTRRTSAVVEGVEVVREETLGAAGELERRVTRKSRGPLLVFESTEHPLLSPAESLPYTYGEAATFSIDYRYDDAGRILRKAYDRAIDGDIEGEEHTTYHPSGAIAETTTLSHGKLSRRASFDAAGNPLIELDAGDYGRRWAYDPAGLLAREEQVAAGVVTERSEWTMRAKKQPLRRITFKVSTSGGEIKVAEATWTYDARGVPTALDGWETITGSRRVKHTELDARGRVTLFVEENEEPTCRRYQQVSEYGDGETPVQQTTTCDGRPFERLRTVFDAQGRRVRVERGFYGNPLSITEDVTAFAYDACGRLVSSEMSHNGALQRRENYSFDAAGRMRLVEAVDRTGTTTSSAIVYDESGRVVAMDGKRWTYDAEGRVTAIEYDRGIVSGPSRARVFVTRFRYACGA